MATKESSEEGAGLLKTSATLDTLSPQLLVRVQAALSSLPGSIETLADLAQQHCEATGEALPLDEATVDTLVDYVAALPLEGRPHAARALRFCTRGFPRNLDRAISSGAIERLVDLLKHDTPADAGRCWATAALTGIMWRGDAHCSDIMERGAAPFFVVLLRSEDPVAERQGCQALGNLVHGPQGTAHAERLVGLGCLPLLCTLLGSFDPVVREKSALVVRNIADCTHGLKEAIVANEELVRRLGAIVCKDHEAPDTVEQALASLCNLCAGPTVHRVMALAGLLPRLVQHLTHEAPGVRGQAAWTLANMCGSGEDEVDEVLKHGALKPMLGLLQSNDLLNVRVQAAWALSNVSVGKDEHRQALVEHGGVNAFIAAMHDPDLELQIQAAWALSALAGEVDYRQELVEHGALEVLEHWILLPTSDEPGPRNAQAVCRRQVERILPLLRDAVGQILPPKAAI